VAHYRAALAIEQIDVANAVALATDLAEDGSPVLWVISDDPDDPIEVAVKGTPVRVVRIGTDDARVAHVARRAVPIAGAAWLFSRKDPPKSPISGSAD
jgi:hypothetical protein